MRKWQVIACTNWSSLGAHTSVEPVYDSLTIATEDGPLNAKRTALELNPSWLSIPAGHIQAVDVTESTTVESTKEACLVLRYRNGSTRTMRSLSSFPVDAMGLDVADVVKVTASGMYLEYVRAQFKGLPDSCLSEKARVKYNVEITETISWYGDMAKFIVGNLQV